MCRRVLGRVAGMLCALLLLAVSVLSVSAAMPLGYTKNRLSVITEAGKTSKYVDYMKGGKELAHKELPWVKDAARGQAVALSGEGEYLRVTSEPLPLIKSSLTAWVNWEDNGTEPILFSMTSNVTNDTLTVSLFHNDAGIAGVYFRFWHVDGTLDVEWYNPVDLGVSYPIPQNEWHHIAFVSDGQTFYLYIDGKLWFEETVILSLVEMRANRLFIGAAGDTTDKTLKAKLADVCLFDKALDANGVKTVMAGGNPFDSKATTSTAPTDELYYPTAPKATTTAPTWAGGEDDAAADEPAEWGGIPLWAWALCGGIVLAAGVASSLLGRRKGGDAR